MDGANTAIDRYEVLTINLFHESIHVLQKGIKNAMTVVYLL